MKTPRVAHFVFDLIRGGTEGQCARIAMGLAQRGLPHRVAVFHRRGFFLDAVESACGPVREVAIRHVVQPATVIEVARFAAWLRKERIDLLHAWDADAAIFGQFAAQMAGVKFATSRRDLGQIYPRWKLALMRRADRVAVRIVANAEVIRKQFASQGVAEGKIDVLPNLLDLDDFDERARRSCPQAGRLPVGRRMVVVNRLDPEKHTGLLIEALPLVRKEMSDAVLVIVGDGPEMPTLRAQAAAMGVTEAVCFLGEVADVPALLAQCEAGALVPNLNEGLSNTILEYMAAGLPVLATDCGGNSELVNDDETGALVAVDASPQKVAEIWRRLVGDRSAARSMGAKGRQKVSSEFSPEEALCRFEAFYRLLGQLPS